MKRFMEMKPAGKTAKQFAAAACCLTVVMLAGCSDTRQAEEINSYLEENYSAPEKETYPEADDLISRLEDAGFETTRADCFEELGISTVRIKAVKDDQYLDICYNVTDKENVQDIIDYYMQNYDRCNLTNSEGTVFCCSSDSVMEQAGLW